MKINFNPSLGTNLKYEDLENGDVFISIDRDCADIMPGLLMKVVDSSDTDHPKYYVLDLETGELFDDTSNYNIDKVITTAFNINY